MIRSKPDLAAGHRLAPYFGQRGSVGSETVNCAEAMVMACGVNGTPILLLAVAVIVVTPQAKPEVATPLLSMLATSGNTEVQVTCVVMSRVSTGWMKWPSALNWALTFAPLPMTVTLLGRTSIDAS